ncbi:MAG: hypothetical protein J0H25_19245 [Rhizobiales bacterium]|jgi:hypothetical protein|nr:hypothetical protein [Hyphomicrobiales bacterium]
MRFLILVWVLLAVSAAGAAWIAMRPCKRRGAWLGIVLAVVLLAAFAASFIVFGSSVDKSFVAVASYFFNWGMAAGGGAICIGAIVGLALALAFKG